MAKPITKIFYDWCIEEDRYDLLERWDYEKNNKNPNEVGFSSSYKAYFKCENGMHESEKHCLNSKDKIHLCRKCQSFENWCILNNHKEYLDNWNYKLNKCKPIDVSAKSNKKYYFYCGSNRSHIGYYSSLNSICVRENAMNNCIECNSLEKWCVDNNRIDILNRWDYELNKNIPIEIYKNQLINIYLKCPKGKHKSEKYSLPNITASRDIKNSGKCRECNSFAQYLIDLYGENALEKYWDYDKNKLNPWNIGKSSRKYVYIKCQEKEYHGSYRILCVSFTTKGCRCSYCNDTNTTHRLDSVGELYPKIKEYWDGNIEDLYSIAPFSNKVYSFNCKIHGKFKRKMVDANQSLCICSKCSRDRNISILQENVKNYILNNYNYTLLHENECTIIPTNPKTGHKLPFDNEIVELKLIIEVNGIQHYEICGFHVLQSNNKNTTTKDEFEYGKWKDNYKKEYAIQNGYNYLEVPYWLFYDDSYKKTIDEKINRLKFTL